MMGTIGDRQVLGGLRQDETTGTSITVDPPVAGPLSTFLKRAVDGGAGRRRSKVVQQPIRPFGIELEAICKVLVRGLWLKKLN